MSTQTNALSDLQYSPKIRTNRPSKYKHNKGLTDPPISEPFISFKSNSSQNHGRSLNVSQVETHQSVSPERSMSSIDKLNQTASPLPSSVEVPAADSSQLALILSKFAELDAIKTHLNTIDTHFNLLQSQLIQVGLVAQRS